MGNALTFDGSNEYVDLGDIADWSASDNFSVEAWIRTTVSGSAQTILSRSTGVVGWLFHVRTSNKIALHLGTGSGVYTMTEGSTSVNGGGWTHVVATYDGSSTASGISLKPQIFYLILWVL